MKKFLRKAKVALTPRSSYIKTVLANGAVLYGKNKRGFGGRGIYILRDEIEPEFKYFELFLDKTGVFIDIGANTGIYSLTAAKHYENSGVVLSLEPFPEVFNSLAYSVKKNKFTNVRLRNLCASSKTEERVLWLNENEPSLFSVVTRVKDSPGISVLGVCIDDLVIWEKLERVDFIKIDVEGAEEEVLLGAIKTINRFRPIIQAEIIIKKFKVDLKDYLYFQASGRTLNVVMIPKESPKIDVARKLGWKEITS